MAGGEVVVFASDFLLELSHFLRKEFHGTAATGADHVMVAAAIVLMLVARDTVVEGDFGGESALGEKLQGTVDRGVTDTRIFFLHQTVQLVGGEVVARFQKSAENCVALGRLLQADVLEMAVQDVLSLAHHLARESGLIVDALLQHG